MTERRWTWALALAAAVSVLPLFTAKYLPFSDLPEHVATIAAFQRLHDPAFRVSEHFAIAWGESQYFLYHLVGAGLAKLVGSARVANLLLLAGVGFAYPFALRSLLRALDRDERLALFAPPLFFSHALVVGLLPFVASVPLVVVGLALVVRQAKAPTRRRYVALAGIGVLLLFTHVASLLVFVLAALGLCFAIAAERGSRLAALRALPRRASWLAPTGILFVAWSLVSKVGRHGASLREPGQITFTRTRALVRAFAFWSHDAWPSHGDEVLAVVFWSMVGALAFVAARRAERAPRLPALLVPLLTVVVVYLALPNRIGGTDAINVRLGVFVPLFVLLVVDLGKGATSKLALGVAAFLVLASAANNTREIRLAQRSLGNFDRVLAAMEPGARVVTLTTTSDVPPDHFPPWIHVTAYHRVEHGGVSEPSFGTLGHWPLQYRAGAAPPPKRELFWEFAPCLYRNAEDGPYYDHVLVNGELEPFADRPPGPAFRPVLTEGPWTLYRKIPGEMNGAWDVPDQGPCKPRATLRAGAPKPS